MKNFVRVLGVTLIALLIYPLNVNAECVVYEHAEFEGRQSVLEAGDIVSRMQYWNDRISSLDVTRNCHLTVYEHAGFKGASRIFNRTQSYVGDHWNDRISSMECQCSRQNSPGFAKPPRISACQLYQHADFEGNIYDVGSNQEDPDLWRTFNDVASSLVVPGNCELWVFEHKDFAGRRKPFGPGHHRYVGDYWNDRISSAACRCYRGGWE